jgi:hypothetical protein
MRTKPNVIRTVYTNVDTFGLVLFFVRMIFSISPHRVLCQLFADIVAKNFLRTLRPNSSTSPQPTTIVSAI